MAPAVSVAAADGVPDTAVRRETIFVLIALGAANFLLAQDLASLNVALPSIERALDVDLASVQWVVNAYLLVYGITIVTGGRVADEIGRRRVFLIGAAIFVAAALAAGLAPHLAWLVAARAVMGIGSGLMLPSALGMAFAAVPPRQAALAGGAMTGAYAIGMAIGPIVGGALIGAVGWRAPQFLNVLLALLVILAVWRAVPASAAPSARPKIDLAGIVALSASLLSLLVAIDRVTAWGWRDWRVLLGLGLAAVLMALFVVIERRTGADALVPGDLLRLRAVSVACVLKLLFSPAYSVVLLYVPQIMGKLLGFTPFQTGLGLLPMLGGYAIVSFLHGAVSARLGARIAIIAGLASITAGMFLLARYEVASTYALLVPGLLAFGVGLGLFQPAIATEAVQADDRERKSLISGLIFMIQFVAGAVGLGLTTTIVASSERAAVDAQLASMTVTLPAADRAALNGLLAGSASAQRVLDQLGSGAQMVIDMAHQAFAAGVRAGFRLDAFLAAAAFVVAVLKLGRPARR